MVGTAHGDGTVSWASGRIGGIGQYFYMPAEHGDLASTKEYFPALVELLTTGATARLATTPPATRAIEAPLPVSYDAGPPVAFDILAPVERCAVVLPAEDGLDVRICLPVACATVAGA